MSGDRSGACRLPERGLPGVAAADPRSYDLPDFRTLGDGPYPPILLEAFERAGNGFRRWSEQVEHAGYWAAVLFASGDESSRWTGPLGRSGASTRPRGSPMTCCWSPAGAVVLLVAGPVRAGTGGTLFISWPPGFGAARGFPIRWSPIRRSSPRSRRRRSGRCTSDG
jgi:hypothetical protein